MRDIGVTAYQQRLIDAYNGKLKETCDKIGFNYTYARKLMTSPEHYQFQEKMGEREVERQDERILDRKGVQQLWSDTAEDESQDMKHRLVAARDLEKSRGGFVDRIEISDYEKMSDGEIVKEIARLQEKMENKET